MARITGTFMYAEEKRMNGIYVSQNILIETSTDPSRPNPIQLQAKADREIRIIETLKKGQFLVVDYREKGRFYIKEGVERHYQTLDIWQLSIMQSSVILPQDPDPTPPVAAQATPPAAAEMQGDLPEFLKPTETTF